MTLAEFLIVVGVLLVLASAFWNPPRVALFPLGVATVFGAVYLIPMIG